MNDTMKARMARAICESHDDIGEGVAAVAADAALAVMREPTKAMQEAGYSALFGERTEEPDIAAGWRAMIDTALAE